MNEDEQNEFESTITDETRKLLVLIYALELHGLPYFSPYGMAVALTPPGRRVAEELFDTSEDYRNYAMKRVDLIKKDSFREDWRQNYTN